MNAQVTADIKFEDGKRKSDAYIAGSNLFPYIIQAKPMCYLFFKKPFTIITHNDM